MLSELPLLVAFFYVASLPPKTNYRTEVKVVSCGNVGSQAISACNQPRQYAKVLKCADNTFATYTESQATRRFHMARFVSSLFSCRTDSLSADPKALVAVKACLALVVLFAPVISRAQYTNAWVDASSPVFTNGTNGDICLAINNAYLSAGFTGTIDARGFTGPQACNTQPFVGANKYVELLLNRNVQIVTSQSWWTPQVGHIIDGGTNGNNSNQGAILAACGPGNHFWVSPSGPCSGVGPFSATVNQISTNLTFNVAHGPWPGGASYTCLICDGGQGTGSGSTGVGIGWNLDAFSSQIRGLRLDLGGNTNIIGLYTLNEEENSNWNTISCGDYAASGAVATNVACFSIDHTEASLNQSGPGNFVLDGVSVGGPTLITMDASQSYGGMALGENITLVWLGCTVAPVAFVTGVAPLVGGGGMITGIAVQNGGTCSSPTVTANFPSSMGSIMSGKWNNPTTAGNAVLTANVMGGSVQSVTISSTSGTNTNYPVGFVGGMKRISTLSLNGASSTARLNGGLIIEGQSNIEVSDIHSEKMVATNGSGDAVQVGTFGFQANGFFHNINSNSDVQGAALHFGVGIDNTQTATALQTFGTQIVYDQKNNETINASACGGFGGGLSLYIPGTFYTCQNNPLTFFGSTSGSATIGASATGSKLQLNGSGATVDSSGNLTAGTLTLNGTEIVPSGTSGVVLSLGTLSGTPAVVASTPLAINTSTGGISLRNSMPATITALTGTDTLVPTNSGSFASGDSVVGDSSGGIKDSGSPVGGIWTTSLTAAILPTGTVFLSLNGTGATYAAISNATETLAQTVMSRAGTVNAIYAHVSSPNGAAETIALTLSKNTVTQSVTCTIAASSSTCSNSNSFTFAAGDLLTVKMVETGASPSSAALTVGVGYF
jgi:hypothetical protein